MGLRRENSLVLGPAGWFHKAWSFEAPMELVSDLPANPQCLSLVHKAWSFEAPMELVSNLPANPQCLAASLD